MGRRTIAANTTDTSWIKPGAGAYLCTEHRLQFFTVRASHAHAAEAHPETLWTSVARGEWHNTAFGAKIVDTSDMGGNIELWIQRPGADRRELWDTGYKSFQQARDCFTDLVARGEVVRPVTA